MENMEYTLCDNCSAYTNNGQDACTQCILEVVNEDAWIDEALMSHYEGQTELYDDGYGGEWDAYHAQYDVADMDIYY